MDIEFTKDYIVAKDNFDNKFVIFRDARYKTAKIRRSTLPDYDSDDRCYQMFKQQSGLNITGDEMDGTMFQMGMPLRQVKYFIKHGNTTGARVPSQLCVQFDTAAEALDYIETLQSLEET